MTYGRLTPICSQFEVKLCQTAFKFFTKSSPNNFKTVKKLIGCCKLDTIVYYCIHTKLTRYEPRSRSVHSHYYTTTTITISITSTVTITVTTVISDDNDADDAADDADAQWPMIK